MAKRTMFATDKDYRDMLLSVRWRKLRLWKLSHNPCCEECEKAGLAVPAVEVHHRRPVMSVKGRGAQEALMFDPSNLAALCHKCHVEAHRQMGKWGKDEAVRRRKDTLDMFAEKFGLKTSDDDGDREAEAT